MIPQHVPHPPPACYRPCRLGGRGGTFGILDFPHENLFRPAVRSFRRGALLRSRRRAAEIAWRGAALAVRRRPAARGVAGMGAEPARRYAAGAGRRRQGAAVVRRPRQLADPDRGPEHPGRSGVVGARLAVCLCRAEAAQRSRHRLRGAAQDRCRAGVARPLRSSRCRDAVETGRKILAARDHAARQ